jgi:guanylate kinase
MMPAMVQNSSRLVILAGPSCVGRSTLAKALHRLHPDLARGLQPLVLHHGRDPRPGERDGIDYHFHARLEIANDREQLERDLGQGDVMFEGNPFVGEIRFLRSQPSVSLPDLVTDVMRRKQLRRMQRQKGELSLKDLENIETRASSAYGELGKAHRFRYALPNHDGEDSEDRDAFHCPLGDARRALDAFAGLLRGDTATGVESWDASMLP